LSQLKKVNLNVLKLINNYVEEVQEINSGKAEEIISGEEAHKEQVVVPTLSSSHPEETKTN
jgi:hypothetical protein